MYSPTSPTSPSSGPHLNSTRLRIILHQRSEPAIECIKHNHRRRTPATFSKIVQPAGAPTLASSPINLGALRVWSSVNKGQLREFGPADGRASARQQRTKMRTRSDTLALSAELLGPSRPTPNPDSVARETHTQSAALADA